MVRKVEVIAAVLFSFFVLHSASAQKFPPPPKLPPRPTDRPFVSQELHAPYWTLEPGWHTDFEVRNNLGFKDLTITPVLRTYSGVEIELDPVTLKPDEITTIDLEKAAEKYSPNLLHTVTLTAPRSSNTPRPMKRTFLSRR